MAEARGFTPCFGKILVDGQDILNVKIQSLREKISFIPQNPSLFHRSIRENIGYGDENASLDDIINAARKANAHDFITELPEGYDTVVGEQGIKLSGGQRQRVVIARAILKDAPILILDEATSSLDSSTETKIQEAMSKAMSDKTAIVIAHRLSTIMQMDRIVVLDKGGIVQLGSHDELIKTNGMYKSLWDAQTGTSKI